MTLDIRNAFPRGVFAAFLVAAAFAVSVPDAAFAIDPGLGVGRPGPGVRRAPVVRAPVARAAAVPGPVYALPRGCVATVVDGVRVHRCGAVVYRPTVQAGRTVYVVVP